MSGSIAAAPPARRRSKRIVDDRMVSIEEACERCGGVAPSTLFRWERDPALHFPRRRQMGPKLGRVGFLLSELTEWILARPVTGPDPRRRRGA
jgi:predicted DNA-binding transcriptional regulator AlpA